jgi:hypothetical protein
VGPVHSRYVLVASAAQFKFALVRGVRSKKGEICVLAYRYGWRRVDMVALQDVEIILRQDGSF